MAVKPIKPQEVKHKVDIPDFIIEAVNQLIAKNIDRDGSVRITQDEILEIVSVREPDGSGKPLRDEVFKNNWLDFEDLYRKAGWNVVYHRPAYYEDWKAYFTFKSK